MVISFSPALEKDIEEIISNHNVKDICEVLRNAVVLYKYLIDEISNGNRLCIADSNNRILKELVLENKESRTQKITDYNIRQVTSWLESKIDSEELTDAIKIE